METLDTWLKIIAICHKSKLEGAAPWLGDPPEASGSAKKLFTVVVIVQTCKMSLSLHHPNFRKTNFTRKSV